MTKVATKYIFDAYTFIGEGATTLLQGQLTADVGLLAPGEITPTCWCNPQGRMLATGFVAKGEDNLLRMFFPCVCRAKIQSICTRLLPFFRVKMDIDICNVSHLPYPKAFCKRNAMWIADIQQNQCAHGNGHCPQSPIENMDTLTNTWLQHWWQAGVVFIANEQHIGKYIPSDWAWDIFAISFTKGCYTGQEIVARVRYRGKPKKRFVVGMVVGVAQVPASLVVFDAQNQQQFGLDATMPLCGESQPHSWLIAAQIPHVHDTTKMQVKSDCGDTNRLLYSPLWLKNAQPIENIDYS